MCKIICGYHVIKMVGACGRRQIHRRWNTSPPDSMLLLAVGTKTGSISAEGLGDILLFKQGESGWQSSVWLLDASRPPFKNAVCSRTRKTEEASVVFSWMENIVAHFAVGGDPVEVWVVQHVCKWKKGMKSEVTADGSKFSWSSNLKWTAKSNRSFLFNCGTRNNIHHN